MKLKSMKKCDSCRRHFNHINREDYYKAVIRYKTRAKNASPFTGSVKKNFCCTNCLTEEVSDGLLVSMSVKKVKL